MRVNIIKISTKNTHLITIKCEVARIFLKKTISSLENITSSMFLINFFVTIQSGTNCNAGRKSISIFITHFLGLIYIRTIFQLKMVFRNSIITHFLTLTSIGNRVKHKRTNTNNLINHFLSLIAFKNQLYCRRRVNSFITQFLSFITVRDKFK